MKKKIVAMALVLSMVFAYCLSNLNLPVQAEEGTADFDQQIQKAEEEKKKAESHLENLEKDLKELEKSKGNILNYI